MTREETAANVLLSIRPEQAEAILDGRKRWEYRRVAPDRDEPIRYVLYANEPVAAAIGTFWSFRSLSTAPVVLVDETIDRTPNDAADILVYLDDLDEATAIHVSTSRRFENPVSREELEEQGFEPAQNFRYLPDVPAWEAGNDSRGIA